MLCKMGSEILTTLPLKREAELGGICEGGLFQKTPTQATSPGISAAGPKRPARIISSSHGVGWGGGAQRSPAADAADRLLESCSGATDSLAYTSVL